MTEFAAPALEQPVTGGSFVRNDDGSLTTVVQPPRDPRDEPEADGAAVDAVSIAPAPAPVSPPAPRRPAIFTPIAEQES